LQYPLTAFLPISQQEDAPTDITVVICFSSFEGSISFPAIKDQPEVCPLSGGVRAVPYPPDYRAAFAFSGLLYPHPQQRTSRLACLFGQGYGLTVFRVSNNGRLAANFLPVVVLSSFGYYRNPKLTHCAVLARACQHVWLFQANEIYRWFTYVQPTSKPSTLPRHARSSASPLRD
jgi:hypothetical protein